MKLKRMSKTALIPRVAYESPGIDFACDQASLSIAPHSIASVPTGWAIEIPQGHVGLFRDRSSLPGRGLTVVAGVIDPDYRGQIMLLLHNFTEKHIVIERGQYLAQLIVVPFTHLGPTEVVEELGRTQRGDKGFGSSDEQAS